MSRRTLLIVLVLAVSVALGAMREFLFINLNYQIDFVRYQRPVSYAHSMFQGWVEGAAEGTLLSLKWGLSVLFIAMMTTLAVMIARLLWGDHRYRVLIVAGSMALAVLALFSHWLAGLHPAFRTVSIQLLHSLQYPVILFILVGASMLRPWKALR